MSKKKDLCQHSRKHVNPVNPPSGQSKMVITVFMLTIKKFGNPYLNFLFEFWRSDALCFRFTAQCPMLTVKTLAHTKNL